MSIQKLIERGRSNLRENVNYDSIYVETLLSNYLYLKQIKLLLIAKF